MAVTKKSVNQPTQPSPNNPIEGWRWVKVSDQLMQQMKDWEGPLDVKMEEQESGEVVIVFREHQDKDAET
jgi:hypothetical protein